jgi:hypothetical protein
MPYSIHSTAAERVSWRMAAFDVLLPHRCQEVKDEERDIKVGRHTSHRLVQPGRRGHNEQEYG